jgi:hypothetical protein
VVTERETFQFVLNAINALNNPLSDGFRVNHQVVREFGQNPITEFGIGRISRFSAA